MPETPKNNVVLCEFCGKKIPRERLKILPETTCCVKCSQTMPYSEAEVIGLRNGEADDSNRLNMEDYEDMEGDISLHNDDSW
ncbi:TraR/DksA C4-type zinc finger protein [bacterium]|nr:TraR/DksA C4-type zinc finger protein [bacterium]